MIGPPEFYKKNNHTVTFIAIRDENENTVCYLKKGEDETLTNFLHRANDFARHLQK